MEKYTKIVKVTNSFILHSGQCFRLMVNEISPNKIKIANSPLGTIKVSKFAPQLYLGSLLGTHRSAIILGIFLFLVIIPEVSAKVKPEPELSTSLHGQVRNSFGHDVTFFHIHRHCLLLNTVCENYDFSIKYESS